MYEYMFERITMKSFSNKPDRDYREVIHSYAADGYRFHSYIPFYGSGYTPQSYDLVFEKNST